MGASVSVNKDISEEWIKGPSANYLKKIQEEKEERERRIQREVDTTRSSLRYSFEEKGEDCMTYFGSPEVLTRLRSMDPRISFAPVEPYYDAGYMVCFKNQ